MQIQRNITDSTAASSDSKSVKLSHREYCDLIEVSTKYNVIIQSLIAESKLRYNNRELGIDNDANIMSVVRYLEPTIWKERLNEILDSQTKSIETDENC